jgi:mono/diheme cytochrome c family protein
MNRLTLLALASCLTFAVTHASANTKDDVVHAAEVASANAPGISARISSGEKLYSANCAVCHQANGKGLTGAFPPLAESDYIAENPIKAIEAVLNGFSGPITVNGKEYNSVMPNLAYMSDSDIADVVTFVINSFGNKGGEVVAAQVAAARGGEKVAGPADHPDSSDSEISY